MKKHRTLFALFLTLSIIVCSFNSKILVQASENKNQLAYATKYIALTFDDGPISKTTSKLLDALDECDAKATFFLVGTMISYYKDTVKRIYDSGHEIGNHSYSHRDFTTLSNTDVSNEIKKTSDLIKSITGANPTLIRPPYGAHNKTTDYICTLYNLPVIMWNVDPEDWKYRDVDYVYNKVKSNLKDGNIILLHDIHATTVEAAIRILRDFSGKGYEFVTLSELAEIKGIAFNAGHTYYSIR